MQQVRKTRFSWPAALRRGTLIYSTRCPSLLQRGPLPFSHDQ